jgi:hypothetical protein
VGTTDVDHLSGPDNVHISTDERQYLESIVRRLFPDYRREPIASYSSLRPLLAENGRSATATSREHRIWESADGVFHIAGGKYTTFRLMSEELVDALLLDATPGRSFPSRTASVPLDIPVRPADVSEVVRIAVEREFARKLGDVIYVSTYWGYERRLSADWLEPIAREMGSLLGWGERLIENEVESAVPSKTTDFK